MLIVSKYFIYKQDYINTICVCKKFKETTEKLRFNPISITSLKLFPKIQTQYLYDQNDKKLDIVEHQEIWYEVDYEEYLKYKENNIKCHHITYTKRNRKNLGDTLSNDITKLGYDCFSYSNLLSITIPNCVTAIEINCFKCCGNLLTMKLPSGISKLNNYCFSSCTSLSSITIPSSVQSIGNYCFYDCSSLTSINIPNSVTSIGVFGFFNCNSLQSIKLPLTVSTLTHSTFRKCSSLTNITIPTMVTLIDTFVLINV